MKTFLTLLLTLFCISTFSQDIKIPRKTNQILIYKKDSALNLLKDYAKTLQDRNFNIDKLDKDLLSIKTESKTFKFAGVATMKIFATVKQKGDSAILKITGSIEVTNPLAGGQIPFESCFCGMAGSAQLNSFKEILATIEPYKEDRIVYIKNEN